MNAMLDQVDYALLCSLVYEDKWVFEGNQGKSLSDIISIWRASDLRMALTGDGVELEHVMSARYDKRYAPESGDEIVSHVLNDQRFQTLRRCVLVDIDQNHARGSNALCFKLDPDAQDSDATDQDSLCIVVFEGTGTGERISGAFNSEWYTNAMGMAQSDTQPQLDARAYAQSCHQRFGGRLVVTGHSNGGNKAMYCAVTLDDVDACYAYDAQGFGPAFFEKYESQVQLNSHKVQFFGAESDYVGPMLLSLPIEKHYVKRGFKKWNNMLDAFAMNHNVNALFSLDDDGQLTLVPGEQSMFSRNVQDLFVHLLQSRPAQELQEIAPVMGKYLDSTFGTRSDFISSVTDDPANARGRHLFLTRLLEYSGLESLVDNAMIEMVDSANNNMATQNLLAVFGVSVDMLLVQHAYDRVHQLIDSCRADIAAGNFMAVEARQMAASAQQDPALRAQAMADRAQQTVQNAMDKTQSLLDKYDKFGNL